MYPIGEYLVFNPRQSEFDEAILSAVHYGLYLQKEKRELSPDGERLAKRVLMSRERSRSAESAESLTLSAQESKAAAAAIIANSKHEISLLGEIQMASTILAERALPQIVQFAEGNSPGLDK